MKNPLKMIKAYLKKVLSDMHSIILHAILVSLGVGGAVIRLFFENVWTFLKTTMLSSTPLWVTIAMVLVLLVYTYVKAQKSSLKSPKIKYFIIDKFKWEVLVSGKNLFEVNDIPFCAEHNLRTINNGTIYACPELGKVLCKSFFLLKDHDKIYKDALSYIENQIKFPQ